MRPIVVVGTDIEIAVPDDRRQEVKDMLDRLIVNFCIKHPNEDFRGPVLWKIPCGYCTMDPAAVPELMGVLARFKEQAEKPYTSATNPQQV